MSAKHNRAKLAEALEAAANLIEPRGRWVRDWTARATDQKDRSVTYATLATDPAADCWGGVGAIYCAGRKLKLTNEQCWEAQDFAARAVGVSRFSDWAWAVGRAQEEVVDALRKGAALAGSDQ